MMKVLLLLSKEYSYLEWFSLGLKRLNVDYESFDYRENIADYQRKINSQVFRLPYKLRHQWEAKFFKSINKSYFSIIEDSKTDVIFVYNHAMLSLDTVKLIKQKGIKLVFILGDSPFYIPTNKYYTMLLTYADLIVSQDTGWINQLQTIGIKNLCFDIVGYNDLLFGREIETNKIKTIDTLFVGNGYVDQRGYKRTLFVSQFTNTNLKVFGNKHWLKWIEYFPQLKEHFTLLNKRMSFEEMLDLMSLSKLYPVDINTGIINGIHLRILEAIGAGVLPIVEYRKDIEKVFGKSGIPLIKNYNNASSIAHELLKKNSMREEIINSLSGQINKEYRPEMVINRFFNKIY